MVDGKGAPMVSILVVVVRTILGPVAVEVGSSGMVKGGACGMNLMQYHFVAIFALSLRLCDLGFVLAFWDW